MKKTKLVHKRKKNDDLKKYNQNTYEILNHEKNDDSSYDNTDDDNTDDE